MKIRYIIHYTNGKTFIAEWGTFTEAMSEDISSLQLQTDDGKFHTLSGKRSKYFSRSNKSEFSILKNLDTNLWIELIINKYTGKREVVLLREAV